MPATRTNPLLLVFLFVFLQTNYFSFSQSTTFPIKECEKKLASKNDADNKAFFDVNQALGYKDSVFVEAALSKLESSKSANHYFNARVLWLRANQVYNFRYKDQPTLAKKYFGQALNEAYKTGDDYFIFQVSWAYASMMYGFQQIELAATYYLQTGEICERLGKEIKNRFAVCLPLGEILFQTREYEKSIYYLRKGLYSPENAPFLSSYDWTKYLNAIGQDYQQLGKLDSALVNYEQSMQVAKKTKDSVWIGINSGFMGQIFFLKNNMIKQNHSCNMTIASTK